MLKGECMRGENLHSVDFKDPLPPVWTRAGVVSESPKHAMQVSGIKVHPRHCE